MSSNDTAKREAARRQNGEFGNQHRDEPGSLLVDDPGELIYGYTPEGLLRECEVAARYRLSATQGSVQAATGGPLDVDEIAGELVVKVLKARAEGKTIRGLRTYLSTLSSQVVIDAWNPLSDTDRRAMRIFTQALAEAEATRGRQLTGMERRELATMIRDQWPNPHVIQPTHAFIDVAVVGRARPMILDDDEPIRSIQAPASVLARGAGSWVDQASEMHENQARSVTRVRRLMWNVAAEANDLPYVRPAGHPQNRVTEYRSVLKTEADVVNAIAAWEAGESTPAVTALFAPFGEISESDRRRVANSMRGPLRGRAYDLWISALDFTNNRFAEESQAAWDAFEASRGA